MVLRAELWEPNALSNNTALYGHGVDESFCIFFDEFNSLRIAVSIRIVKVTLRLWVDSVKDASPVGFDRGSSVTDIWKRLQDRVEGMPKLASVCSPQYNNVKDYLPEVELK